MQSKFGLVKFVLIAALFALVFLRIQQPKNPLLETTTFQPTPSSIITADLTNEVSIPTPNEILNTPLPTEQPITSVSESPTPEPTLKAQSIPAATPKTVSVKAGSVVTLEYSNLKKGTLYAVDLSQYNATSYSISWPKVDDLLYSTTASAKTEALESFPRDDDGAEVEFVNHSSLLPVPSNKFLYIYSKTTTQKVTVTLINPEQQISGATVMSTGVYNSNSGASYTTLNIVTRDTWGANPSTWDSHSSADIDSPTRFVWYPVYYKAARIVVHHTAGCVNYSNPAAAVRAVYLLHTYGRGWGDIGYNYLIDQNGTIYEGKLGGDETQGYHAFGAANRMSIGISMIGYFHPGGPSQCPGSTATPPKTPTSQAKSSLIKLMAEKAAFYGFSLKFSDGGTAKWMDKSYTVFGHRTSYSWDYGTNQWTPNQTDCPGSYFFAVLGSWVNEAETYRKTHFDQLKQLTSDMNKSFAQPHEVGTIIVKYKVPENTPEETMLTYVPAYSGISSYTIDGNTIIYKVETKMVEHPTLNGSPCDPVTQDCETEYLVPPRHWLGYNTNPPEYSTIAGFEIDGPEDRAKTLLKIFKLDSRVDAADLKHYFEIQ